MPPTRVAILGGGSIAPYHARHITSSPNLKLIAIIDPFPPGQRLASTLGVAHYATIAALVAEEEAHEAPELWYICTPSGLHTAHATEILNSTGASGVRVKVIMIEKPLCTDAQSGAAVLELARERGVKVAVGHHRRFHPAVRAARAAIVEGKVGRVTAVSGAWTCRKPGGYFGVAAWRGSRTGGGGPVWTNFVHEVDVLRFLVGSGVRRVWAVGVPRRRRVEEDDGGGDGVEEGAAIMLMFANGVVGTFTLADNVAGPFCWEVATGENPLIPKTELPVDCVRVFGTEGTLTVPDGVVWAYDEDKAKTKGVEVGWNVPLKREVLNVDEGIPFREQAEHLGRVCAGLEDVVCSGEDGLDAVKVCEAIVRAVDAGDGLPVDVE